MDLRRLIMSRNALSWVLAVGGFVCERTSLQASKHARRRISSIGFVAGSMERHGLLQTNECPVDGIQGIVELDRAAPTVSEWAMVAMTLLTLSVETPICGVCAIFS